MLAARDTLAPALTREPKNAEKIKARLFPTAIFYLLLPLAHGRNEPTSRRTIRPVKIMTRAGNASQFSAESLRKSPLESWARWAMCSVQRTARESDFTAETQSTPRMRGQADSALKSGTG